MPSPNYSGARDERGRGASCCALISRLDVRRSCEVLVFRRERCWPPSAAASGPASSLNRTTSTARRTRPTARSPHLVSGRAAAHSLAASPLRPTFYPACTGIRFLLAAVSRAGSVVKLMEFRRVSLSSGRCSRFQPGFFTWQLFFIISSWNSSTKQRYHSAITDACGWTPGGWLL